MSKTIDEQIDKLKQEAMKTFCKGIVDDKESGRLINDRLNELIDHIANTITDDMVERLEGDKMVYNPEMYQGRINACGNFVSYFRDDIDAHNHAINKAQTIIKDNI